MAFDEAKHLFKTPALDVNHARHLLFQTPTYAATLVASLGLAASDYAQARRATGADVVRFILNTSLVMPVVEVAGEAGVYELRYEGCRLTKLADRRRFDTLYVRFTEHEVQRFELDGAPIEDPEDMLGPLVVFLSCGTHPKSHVLGEQCVAEIMERGITELERSTWTTLSIDYAVLNSPLSPVLSNMYGFHMDVDSMIDEATRPGSLGHGVLRCKSPPPSRFLSFLMHARHKLGEHLARRRLPVNRESLFNAMIVHPIDHYMAWKMLDGLRFCIDEHKTPSTIFMALVFRRMFLRGVLNPVLPNLISTINQPFYRDFYADLRVADQELADQVTAGVMY